MNKKLLDRILRKAQSPELMEALVNRLSLSDLQSLMLEVYRERAKKLSPRHLIVQYMQNRFTQPAKLSPQTSLEFDRLAYSLLPQDFETIELSPVCPLGTNSVVAPMDQNNTIITIRNTEVCSDCTNVLALECTLRRRAALSKNKRASKKIKLCASHRLLRCQTINEPGSYQHFRIFCLCTAGRDKGSFKFEIESLREHINFYILLLKESERLNLTLKDIRVYLIVYDSQKLNLLQTKVVDVLKSKHADIEFNFNNDTDEGRNYYSGVRFQIYARDKSQTDFLLVDGGFTNWTQQLLSNKKERLLISGIGSERLCVCFAV